VYRSPSSAAVKARGNALLPCLLSHLVSSSPSPSSTSTISTTPDPTITPRKKRSYASSVSIGSDEGNRGDRDDRDHPASSLSFWGKFLLPFLNLHPPHQLTPHPHHHTKLQDPQAALDKSDALLVHLGRQE
jgi:hypothetical protein